ncbi:hypothetical protein BMF94_6249 [Rhodotorula taiwanensis]|uniref:ubiquitinyl hydrolase 1 n=1 Tax=Rhodotorula taiwanensis TaxID=741276 RepID=A0A2S5B253_9BASI|nr:hypothetical protein BMF94_6249 [Rhodotorula taiwanensis]
MSPSPLYDAYQSFSASDLQPVLSRIAVVALVVVVISIVTTLDPNSNSALTWPAQTLDKLSGMATVGISALLGRSSVGKVEWGKVDNASEQAENVVRRYRDTKEGKKKVEGGGQHLPGLLNAAGNLCFLNATLQSMASLPPLLSYLDELVASAEDIDLETPVSLALVNTLEALNTPSSSRPPPLRPVELANALVASSPTRRRLLANSDQQDAHELWVMMRDAVEEEAVRLSEALRRLASRGSGLKEVARMQAGLGLAVGTKVQRRAATDPFFWLRSQRVRCMECGYVRDTRHEGEELLMLSVPPISHCSIHDLLAEYTKTDLVSSYNCRRCALLATLAKYKDQRDRLALTNDSSASPASPPVKTPESNRKPANPFEMPTPAPSTAVPKMTASRKDRRRKVQKLVDRVQEAADANGWERELGEDIKVERSEVAAGKMTRFARSPDVLAIHLNRSAHYSYAGPVKNSCQVTFPEYLNIAPFSDGTVRAPTDSTEPQPTDLYRVASLVVHYGSHSFGHYVAFRRRPPSLDVAEQSEVLPEWYRISDETVQPSSADEALRANPYLLFYERVDGAGRPRAAQDAALPIETDALLSHTPARPRIVERWRANSPSPSQADPAA